MSLLCFDDEVVSKLTILCTSLFAVRKRFTSVNSRISLFNPTIDVYSRILSQAGETVRVEFKLSLNKPIPFPPISRLDFSEPPSRLGHYRRQPRSSTTLDHKPLQRIAFRLGSRDWTTYRLNLRVERSTYCRRRTNSYDRSRSTRGGARYNIGTVSSSQQMPSLASIP